MDTIRHSNPGIGKQGMQQHAAESRLTCQELLEGHAEYLDGILPERELRRFDAHLNACQSCQRYDRVVRRGLLLARNLPEIQPSEHFHEQLQARLMNLDSEPIRRPIVASSATLLVIAAVLAVVAVTPLLMRTVPQPVPFQLAPQVNQIPQTLAPMGAVLIQPTQTTTLTAAVQVRLDEPSYFSPVVISPPAVQTAPSAPRLIAYPSVQATTNR